MNRYDEILTSTGEQAAAEPNKYDAVIQRQRDLPNPRNTLSYVADTNPDVQANIQRLTLRGFRRIGQTASQAGPWPPRQSAQSVSRGRSKPTTMALRFAIQAKLWKRPMAQA